MEENSSVFSDRRFTELAARSQAIKQDFAGYKSEISVKVKYRSSEQRITVGRLYEVLPGE